jgi:hypothetical protein
MTVLLHNRGDFRELIEITATAMNIMDPYLVEKDYWLMHVLWGLQQQGLVFHLKGGTSLSKGYECIHRFSEDIDIKIEPDERICGFTVYAGRNHDSPKHRESRSKYFDWLASYLKGKIPGVTEVERDTTFDDSQKMRSGGIRLYYASLFTAVDGLKDGILLEVGFDRTAPNQPRLITSWAYERAATVPGIGIIDNRALAVPCYEPKFTFVEKLQAVVRKFRIYKQGGSGPSVPANFIRHYYDLYQLLDRADIRDFIGTEEYQSFKKERFGGDDTKISHSDAFKLTDPRDRALFEKEYFRSASLYFKGRPSLAEILARIGKDLGRL